MLWQVDESPLVYLIKDLVPEADNMFERLYHNTPWEQRASARKECYYNDDPVPYSYGNGDGLRTYLPKLFPKDVLLIKKLLEEAIGCKFDVCFLNLYEGPHNFLGWHADDSPVMDDTRPIVTISLGAEREIWFASIGDLQNVCKLPLPNGSACVMAPGMQDTHMHRIPKAGRECGPRISLTFRGYVPVEE